MTKNIFTFLAIAAILGGLVFGWMRVSFFDAAHAEYLGEALWLHLSSPYPRSLGNAFMGSLIIHGRILLFIVILTRLPMGFVGSYLLLMIRAMAVGFSAGMLVMTLGSRGTAFGAVMILIQSIALLLVYGILLLQGVHRGGISLKALLVGISTVLAASAYEAFILPIFIPFFL